MNTEEKARRYDEAFERAKDFMNGEVHYELKMGENIMCWIFPELRESEDEKVREELITHCKNTRCVTEEGAERIAKWIAWLEKQKSHKWSDEDDIGLDDALWCCKQAASIAKDENDMGNTWYAEKWLKSLKGRVQPKKEWSEEDESLRLRTIGALETCKIGSPTKCVDEQINWLKSLKERIGG